jgi:mRNA interferase RelE/StbE
VYEVYLEGAAERDLKRLPVETFHRIVPRIRALAENPRPPGCRKLTGSENDWWIRIGDYRVIYEIDEGKKVVRVFRIRHRREAYQ